MGSLLTRGHPAAVRAVERAIQRGRAPHALLLLGPDGSGKTTLALDLAAGLLCLDEDPGARPCRECAACHKVAHGNHPDLHRVAPEGAGEQIRLGQVQALIGELALLPMEGRVRVCVIEDAQRLNPDAQNALLKALEEPVGETCIVLAADDAAQLLPTVVSRTARLRLGPVPAPDVAALLVELGLADAARARQVAAAAGGRPGLAVALAADPESTLVRGRLARQLLDLLHADSRARLAAASELVATGVAIDGQSRARGPAAARDTDGDAAPAARGRAATGGTGAATGAGTGRAGAARLQPAERRRAVLRVLEAWREVGRDLAVAASGARHAVRQLDLLEDLDAAAVELDRDALIGFLERLDGLAVAVEAYANPELALDSMLLAWPRLGRAA
ncbi:MAG: polymerase subunit delta [Chloroflexota bacterium]|jgi:DNA polymerase-3 subunit delta'|nr:polymerase subunit delta [Chloroflexota bacterium]